MYVYPTYLLLIFFAKIKIEHLFRCEELKLVDRCKKINSREATINEVLLKHSQEHYDKLKSTSKCTDEEFLEDLSAQYDAIYLHPVKK